MTKEAGAKRATLTVRETADILGIGVNQAYEGIARGEIPSFRIGKRIIVPRVAIEKKLESVA